MSRLTMALLLATTAFVPASFAATDTKMDEAQANAGMCSDLATYVDTLDEGAKGKDADEWSRIAKAGDEASCRLTLEEARSDQADAASASTPAMDESTERASGEQSSAMAEVDHPTASFPGSDASGSVEIQIIIEMPVPRITVQMPDGSEAGDVAQSKIIIRQTGEPQVSMIEADDEAQAAAEALGDEAMNEATRRAHEYVDELESADDQRSEQAASADETKNANDNTASSNSEEVSRGTTEASPESDAVSLEEQPGDDAQTALDSSTDHSRITLDESENEQAQVTDETQSRDTVERAEDMAADEGSGDVAGVDVALDRPEGQTADNAVPASEPDTDRESDQAVTVGETNDADQPSDSTASSDYSADKPLELAEAPHTQPTTAGSLIGVDVIGADGEELGEIEQVISLRGEPHAIVATGGFLGIGDTEVALRISDMILRGDALHMVNITEDRFEDMQDVDPEDHTELDENETVELAVE